MKTLQRRGRTVALLATAALALTACGSDEDNAAAPSTPGAAPTGAAISGTIAGAGSSAQTAAVQGWTAGFQTANPGATVNYDPVGSGGGRDQFTTGGVDFAGSDRAFTPEEVTEASARCGEGGRAVDLPLYIAPIAIAYNLEGVESLQLKPATIAKIFNQQVSNWNDPAIAADNPDAELPDLAITPVNRSDDSGTTENFTDYLQRTAEADWPYEADGVWPVQGGEAANGTSGVIAAITAGNGAIGYADASQVGDLGIVAVGVGEEYVDYSPEAAAAVVAGSPREEGRMEGDIAIDLRRDTTESGEYPIVLVSYSLACTNYQDPAKGALVKAFLSYVASEEGQEAAAESAGSAPISDDLRTDVLATIDAIQ